MSQDVLLALEITVVGMGLVFAAILLLWWVMAALVRLTAEKAAPQAEAEAAADVVAPVGQPAIDRKRLAAAAAVALALAQQSDSNQPHEFPLPPTALVSAWQAIMRTRMLNKRGSTR